MKKNLLFLFVSFLLIGGGDFTNLKAQEFNITYGKGDAAFTLTYTPIDESSCSVKCTSGNGPSASTEIIIPQTVSNGSSTYTVTTIPESGFDGASSALNGQEDNFTKLFLPNTITSIGVYAFYGWANLTELHLGTSVNNSTLDIAKNAFNSTSNISSIYCYYTTPPTTNISSSFNSTVKNNATVYVPQEIYNNYINISYAGETINWSNFKTIVSFVDNSITLSADKTAIIANGTDAVTFTVTSSISDDVTKDCTIHQVMDTGSQTVKNPFTTTTAGTYTFYATYSNGTETLTSGTITIVADDLASITLSASDYDITTCESVTFHVMQGSGTGTDVTSECTVYQENGTTITELTDKTFSSTTAGTYTFYATKGDLTSEKINVIVTEAPFYFEASPTTVVADGNSVVTLTVEQCDNDVTADFTFTVNGEAIESNTFAPTAMGEYIVKAINKNTGETIGEITVKGVEEQEWYFKTWVDNSIANTINNSKYQQPIAEVTNDIFTLWVVLTGGNNDNGIILNNNYNFSGWGTSMTFEPKTDHRPTTPQPLSIPETIFIDNEEFTGIVTITEIAADVFCNVYYADEYGIYDDGNELNNNISSITLPKTITKIGSRAFDFSYGEGFSITSKAATPPTIEESTFGRKSSSNGTVDNYRKTLYLRSSSIDAYRAADYWKLFFEEGTIETDPNSIYQYEGDGDWTVAANWNLGEVPAEGEKVFINGNVTVGTEININGITINEGCSLTIDNGGILKVNDLINNGETIVIEDGGQLYSDENGLEVTMKKDIIGYGDDVNVKHGWYTISCPVYSGYDENYECYYENIDEITNLIPTADENRNYDLYRYYEAGTNDYGYDEQYGWWENYKMTNNDVPLDIYNETYFTYLRSGRGYLYASSEDVTLEFTGTMASDDVSYYCTMSHQEDNYKGFNLIGNPFTHNITGNNLTGLDIAEGFYTVTNAGTWEPHLLEDDILPAQGALIKAVAEEEDYISIVKNVTRNRSANNGSIAISVANERHNDIAFVSFSDGHGLNKFPHLNSEAHEVYVNVDDIRYAVATMDKDIDEIPVSFEAKTMGQYTISIEAKDCELSTMTLTDKMTGVKTDMLTDSYTFMATTNDNPQRFVLTLNADTDADADTDFIYINNDEIIINNIEGNGIVYIFDIMGRPMAEYHVNGSANINIEAFANGVYIVRMTDENGVKTQKIVRN